MPRDTKAEAREAARLLHPWARDDVDGFIEALDRLDAPGRELAEELRDREGDARGMEHDIEGELENLAQLVRGALFLARHAIDLVVAPPDVRFANREAVVDHLLSN